MRELDAVDVVVTIEPGVRGVGLRNVPASLQVFDTHFPRFPVLPGVLVLGSLVELARRVCVAADAGEWRLVEAGRIQYRRYVQPGDQLMLTVRVLAAGDRAVVFACEVTVEGALVTRAKEIRMVREA
ncbi:hydroxymyristoyl-ACP dehydratase [Solihabitans fulvus]|uniref:Hydroxymyristoyl-ACP dehydratase n=1 Tax=Solihabitans fulvus TaxID=1892852 RepID=A0A5B2XH15_9PSEU|nr:hotdog domain-containing protein [Solihabitans fulvus]KAA2262693.1 hydroxymyristoyl-ACP dehydratase [Solihabitans fulvus]